MFWFHCGRCGSLFQAKAGETEDRLCTKCGFDPCPGIIELPKEPVKPAQPTKHQSNDKRTIRTRRNSEGLNIKFKLIGFFLVAVILIIVKARNLMHSEEPRSFTVTTDTSKTESEEESSDKVFLNDSIQNCLQKFSGFLAAESPEGRNQFVLSPISTASRMARFFSLNPSMKIDAENLGLVAKSVVHLPDTKAVATHWKTKDGKAYDAVFLEENGEWRLDWDHFARYSDYPWSLFLAGSGPAEGEFRLLARERLAEERKNADTISLMLYAPMFGVPGETGFPSPEFLVSKNSPDGQLLVAAFKLARSGGQVFSSKLPDLNPDGMIRIRVKVQRTEKDMERKFEITRVIACHWYSVDDPGVTPAPSEPAEKN